MRLIDADNVLKALGIFNDRKHGDPHFLNGIETAREIVEQAPTVDAVKQIKFFANDRKVTLDELGTIIRRYNAMPVVRCGLCKHRFLDGDNVVTARCELNHNSLMPDDWYCADGEDATNACQEARENI